MECGTVNLQRVTIKKGKKKSHRELNLPARIDRVCSAIRFGSLRKVVDAVSIVTFKFESSFSCDSFFSCLFSVI